MPGSSEYVLGIMEIVPIVIYSVALGIMMLCILV